MTVQVDNHSLAAGAAVRASAAVRYVHPATPVTGERSPAPLFDVLAEPITGRLDLVGEFDLACGEPFRAAGAAMLAGGAAEVAADLTRLLFIDATGIGLLVEFGTRLAAHGGRLRIVNADPRVGRVFAICGLDAMLTPAPTGGASCRPR